MPRMKHALPPLTQDLLEAFVASAVAWAVRLLGILLQPRAMRRRSLPAFVRRAERFVERIIFLKATECAGKPPKRRTAPLSRPSGFRWAMSRPTLFWKLARIRAPHGASLSQRIVRLLRVIAAPERYIVRFLKQLHKGLRFCCLIPCAPQAVALGVPVPHAPSAADTS